MFLLLSKARLEAITGIPAPFQVFPGLAQNGSLDLIAAGLYDGAILQVREKTTAKKQ